MATITPIGQRVLVKRLEAEEVSAGGIVLPDTAKEKPQEAEVVSLGTGGKDEDRVYESFLFDVHICDILLFVQFFHRDLLPYLLLQNCDIVILFEPFTRFICCKSVSHRDFTLSASTTANSMTWSF